MQTKHASANRGVFKCYLVAAAAVALIASTLLAGAIFAGLHRACFTDSDSAAVERRTVQGVDGVLRLLVGGHLNEAETLMATGGAIIDDRGRFDGASLGEVFA